MAIEYAGGTIVNYTFTDAGTRADLVAKLETQLGNAGWSTISGGGSSDVLMKSAVGPDGQSIRLRLYDPGSGNCAQFSTTNNAGSLTSQINYLLPGSFSWRIILNKYWGLMFRSGAANRTASRAVLYFGTFALDSDVVSNMGGDYECGFIGGNGSGDTTSIANTWRNSMGPSSSASQWRCSTLWTSVMLNYTTNSHTGLRFRSVGNRGTQAGSCYTWGDADLSRDFAEAVIGFSTGATNTSTPHFIGQLFDGALMGGQDTGEAVRSFDGHDFMAITDQASSEDEGQMTLMIAVT